MSGSNRKARMNGDAPAPNDDDDDNNQDDDEEMEDAPPARASTKRKARNPTPQNDDDDDDDDDDKDDNDDDNDDGNDDDDENDKSKKSNKTNTKTNNKTNNINKKDGNFSPPPSPSSSSEDDDDDDENDNDNSNSDSNSKTKNPSKPSSSSSSSSKSPSNTSASKMLAQINEPNKQPEAGIILQISCENFMCHRKMTIDLCSNVNFISGENGSGKSAVLAATQICLGANARRTNRAKNLSGLIRFGDATHAKLRVKLLNTGSDAFQHDIYGDSITVERIIDKKGGGSYRLLDDNLKSRSTLKKDLDSMLDLFNIQVDNPVAVLDQEESKRFLTGKPEAKYAFFCKATELERIDRYYAQTTDSLLDLAEARHNVLKGLKPSCDLVEKFKGEWEECKVLEVMEDNKSEQNIKAAWATVAELSKMHDEKRDEMMAEKSKCEKLKDDLARLNGKMKDADDNSADGDAWSEELLKLTEEATNASINKTDAEAKLSNIRKPFLKMQNEKAKSERDVQKSEKKLANAQMKLSIARDELVNKQGKGDSEKREKLSRISALEAEIDQLKKDINDAAANQNKFMDEFEKRKSDAVNAEQAVKEVNADIQKERSNITALSGAAGSLVMFGTNAPNLANRIKNAPPGKFKGKVFGPVGSFIKISQGKGYWAKLAEAAIGKRVLGTFVCTDKRDLTTLREMRKSAGCRDNECSIAYQNNAARYSAFDARAPDAGVESCIGTLQIEEDAVYNYIVDASRAERKILARDKKSSEDIMLIKNQGTLRMKGGDAFQDVYFYPSGDNWSLMRSGHIGLRSNQYKLSACLGVDSSTAVKDAEENLKQLAVDLNRVTSERAATQKATAETKTQWQHWSRQQKSLNAKLVDKKQEIDNLQDEVMGDEGDVIAASTSHLQSEVEAEEEALEANRSALAGVIATVEAQEPELEAASAELKEILARNLRVVAEMEVIEERIKGSAMERSQRVAKVERQELKITQALATFKESESALDLKKKDVDKKTYQAKLFMWEKSQKTDEDLDEDEHQDEINKLEPVDVKGKTHQYFTAKVKKIEEQLEKERKKRAISNVDPMEIHKKYLCAKKVYETKTASIATIEENEAVLQKDKRARVKKWKSFRTHIAKLTNSTFDTMLNKKGSSGCIEFDHSKKTLDLVVQKDSSQENSQSHDVKALSGGERSFTTLALLLALGEQLETPFRVMDEFDVFLDAVARKIALETLVNSALALSHRQFIFITPQDLSTLKPTKQLKIIKMRAPDRNQATLALA